MPTYQYLCTECGNGLEVQQSFSDDSLTVCPTCTGRLRKVFNAVGVVFKGSGFYRNDSREANKSAATADSSGGSSSDKSSDSKSSESKPSSEGTSSGSSSSGGDSSSKKSESKPAAPAPA